VLRFLLTLAPYKELEFFFTVTVPPEPPVRLDEGKGTVRLDGSSGQQGSFGLQRNSSKVHENNIDAIVRLEAEQEERVLSTDRLSEAVGRFAGTNVFIVVQIAWVAVWLFVNKGIFVLISPFDPFRFPLLSMVLALEVVLLTAFVLIRQNG
jgi:uncharacterized membrane protein